MKIVPPLRTTLAFLVCLAAHSTIALAQADDCIEVLRFAAYDLQEQKAGVDSARVIQENLCKTDYEKSSASQQVELDVGYAAFKASGGASQSNAREYQKTECGGKFGSDRLKSQNDILVKTVSDNAVKMYNMCKQLAAQKVGIRLQRVHKSIHVSFRAKEVPDAIIQGVKTTSGTRCTDADNKVIPQGGANRRLPIGDTVTISCERDTIKSTKGPQTVTCNPRTSVAVLSNKFDAFAFEVPEECEPDILEQSARYILSRMDRNVPNGLIAAFDLEKCPDGWTEFTAMRGRMPIGAGPWATDASKTRLVGAQGGRDTTKLALEHMPKHSHEPASPFTAFLVFAPNASGDTQSLSHGKGYFQSWHGAKINTAEAGGDQPFEILPPHRAVLYCKKQSAIN